jgi:hypothetical protein
MLHSKIRLSTISKDIFSFGEDAGHKRREQKHFPQRLNYWRDFQCRLINEDLYKSHFNSLKRLFSTIYITVNILLSSSSVMVCFGELFKVFASTPQTH